MGGLWHSSRARQRKCWGTDVAAAHAQVVSDQVRLWQADTQRVRSERAVLYDDFPSPQVRPFDAQPSNSVNIALTCEPRAAPATAGHLDILAAMTT